ncbi:TIGR02530 family flagellar biosynthesis protein [Butyrivibrio sp. MC2013]|uniref:TIGR02530 family flagellar biosynthesis protein n=1 Tax=Butyrivibrio sp. MC2013 TaxID=1280686 RepID=UPI0004187E65|nr:TIGR02530 family flagellar biosynthesis protein [Butyrivibrio sp. MC2013]
MDRINPSFLSINEVQDRLLGNGAGAKPIVRPQDEGESFQSILQREAGKSDYPRFSRHASARLSERNITLTPGQMERLNEGKLKAGEKGIHDSLILVDSLAFIVNVPNNTVVTAMDADSEDSGKIFTNIDGAVIA